jgi:uncharacterized protein
MEPTRILSLDGGGIRGYLTVLLLEQLFEERPTLLDEVHLFAGTSVGSIVALALASGYSPTEVRFLFEQEGKNIFPRRLIPGRRDIGRACLAKYDNKNLKKILNGFFGEKKLLDIDKRVLIASFDLCREGKEGQPQHVWDAKFFHNYPGTTSDGDEYIVDVILRSSAAPFYFPSYQGFVDGFVTANNPSTCALAKVLKANDIFLNAISMLSVGTGINPRCIDDENGDWGWAKWLFRFEPLSLSYYALPLVYMMWEGSTNLANYQCEQLLGDRFHRIDLALPTLVDIDEVNKMGLLAQVTKSDQAQKMLAETIAWLDSDYWQKTTTLEKVASNGNQTNGKG